ncbi:MAG: response regulator [Acidobacteriaceae bacterium]|nr:response regulator [Acidobacteriaceae bacterium]
MAPLIAVVDDDVSVRESLEGLMRSAGLSVRVFASAQQFLNSPHLHKTACLVLDVRMPGMNGTELHHHLLSDGCNVPVIFITAHASDQDTRARALSDGAVAYLIKPFEESELLGAVQKALISTANSECGQGGLS